MRAFFAFALVGSGGFVVDGGLLTLLSQKFGLNIYLARAISFTVATAVTWLANRSFVFKTGSSSADRRRHEYSRYFLVQVSGALLNLAVFAVVLNFVPAFESVPIIPFAIGSGFGLLINYSGSRFWVFRGAGV